MAVTYHIVAHDNGFAYKAGDTFSQTYLTREEARQAARDAAAEQEQSGQAMSILYETEDGEWKREDVSGRDRPHTQVEG